MERTIEKFCENTLLRCLATDKLDAVGHYIGLRNKLEKLERGDESSIKVLDLKLVR